MNILNIFKQPEKKIECPGCGNKELKYVSDGALYTVYRCNNINCQMKGKTLSFLDNRVYTPPKEQLKIIERIERNEIRERKYFEEKEKKYGKFR